ncbi:methylmalonyl-CoA mutase family protein [Brevibacillus choshinensis]|uniref:Acyl-CoA mutase large subunit family protein n=1 Tax=Brevibacillus choshinensis TaxID=54911 RepID=A0ABX7FWB3_BRECH|nr:methylmalonyl-CoA mutase family protein [Brevibacillus choshinensis]QRG70139.1 acyl-CoA mutase large subunit family protein [Brevibacillus choshinensis]
MNKDTLFKEFSVPTYDQWREAAEKTLKGASFDAKLLTKTYEGITLQPIYRQEDVVKLVHIHAEPGCAPYLRGTNTAGSPEAQSWEVAQEILTADAAAFNEIARGDLERGQTMLNLVFDQATRSGRNPEKTALETVGDEGLSIFSLEDLATAFADINLEEVPVYAYAGPHNMPILSLLVAHLKAAGRDVSKLRGCVGADPFAALVTEGTLPGSKSAAFDGMAQATQWAAKHAPQLKTILVQGHPYHDAGAHSVQELAYALATGVEYVQAMLERGLSIEDIAPRMQFAFSVGSHVFMEIAKIRAARMLWAAIMDSYGGSEAAQKMTIHARTSAWTKTVLDPNVNMLRATTEAFSAVVAGVDSLHVSAFDEAIRPANEFSRRIARNTQIILEKEAHLAKVADPAGGSWYVEKLTDELAEKVWELFLQVEEQGGMRKALESGIPQSQIEEVAVKKAANVAQRKTRVVGTNMYANALEHPEAVSKLAVEPETRLAALEAYLAKHDRNKVSSMLEALSVEQDERMEKAIQAVLAGATLGELTKVLLPEDQERTCAKPLRRHRLAEPFETLRQRAVQYEAKTGHKPKVFLVNMGPVSKHKARADFAAEFFTVGGFEVLRSDPFASSDEAALAVIASKAPIAVICSDDGSYPEIVPALAQAIKRGNPEMTLLLAGLPDEEQFASYKNVGLDDCIHIRTNCYQVLRDLSERIGVMS